MAHFDAGSVSRDSQGQGPVVSPLRWGLFLTLAAAAYGSLYPFQFQYQPPDPGTLIAFVSTWRLEGGLGNLLANIVLFAPIGFFGLLVQSPDVPVIRRWLVVLAGGFGFAVALQLIQFFLPARMPAMEDALINLVGLLAGAGLAALPLAQRVRAMGAVLPVVMALPLLLLTAWLAYRLSPFVPTLDWQTFKNDLKPLLLTPELTLRGIARNLVCWLVFHRLLQACGIRPHHIFWLIPATLIGEALVVHNAPGANAVAGAALAAVLAPMIVSGSRILDSVLAASVALVVIWEGLAPYYLAPEAGRFHWLPLHGFLGGSTLANLKALFEKIFLYGSLIWLLLQATRSRAVALIVPVAITLGVEIVQVQLPGRTAEITDPLLCVALYLLAHRAGLSHHRSRAATIEKS